MAECPRYEIGFSAKTVLSDPFDPESTCYMVMKAIEIRPPISRSLTGIAIAKLRKDWIRTTMEGYNFCDEGAQISTVITVGPNVITEENYPREEYIGLRVLLGVISPTDDRIDNLSYNQFLAGR